MSIIWQYGRDTMGYNWMCATGDANLPCVYWRDDDLPEKFRYLAEQVLELAQSEAEQIKRLQMQSAVHALQAQAFQAIAAALESGKPIIVTVEGSIMPKGKRGGGNG